jgi:tRNA pseudouridine13 synthase
LADIFGEDTTQSIKKLHATVLANPHRKRRDFTNVVSRPMDDKVLRTQAHVTIRRIFSSRLESTTEGSNKISISAAPPQNKNRGVQKFDRHAGGGRAKGKLGWDELGGEFLHMTVFKENKDTMEIMYYLASSLKVHVRNFQFAGTKDRRGVTVQRVSACRVRAEQIANIAKQTRGAKIGGLKYEKTPLALGQLQGNEFCITLRDCHFPGEEDMDFNARILLAKMIVEQSVQSLQTKGFINYYGLQRFGSFASSTDDVGKKLLQGDLKGAIDLILSYAPSALAAAQEENPSLPIPLDDRKRALALYTWETTGSFEKALNIMPRKFNAENGIIRHLSIEKGGRRINERDWQGALASIQRGLRLMYVHAYQSLVWNTVAAHRWEKFGGQVVEGDLVIATSKDEAVDSNVDDLGELIVRPAEEDRALDADAFVRARPLSKDEAESGSFDIWDIVLPLPGYDVKYPANEIGQFYVEFMGSEKGGGLDPYDMRRTWKDISLSGGYRKFLARPAQMQWEVKSYTGDNEQLVETDLDKLVKNHNQGPEDVSAGEKTNGELDTEKVAVILRLQLGSSQYATIALRELLKAGGMKSFKSDFSRER